MSMFPIASQTVGSGGASSVIFSSIPQTFTHLQVRMFAKSTNTSGTVQYGFAIPNNDLTTSLYAVHYLTGDGATASSGSAINSSQFSVYNLPGSTSAIASQVFGSAIIDILDYANTNKNKTSRSIGGFDANGSGQISLTSNLYQSTTAITSLGMYISGNLVAGSRLDLYGISTSNATGA